MAPRDSVRSTDPGYRFTVVFLFLLVSTLHFFPFVPLLEVKNTNQECTAISKN